MELNLECPQTPEWIDLSKDHPRRLESIFHFAQDFSAKSVYSIRKDVNSKIASKSTVYKKLHELESFGLAKFSRDSFEIKQGVVSQPFPVFKKLIPSLLSLKNSRRFGRYYNELDVNFAKKNLPGKFLTTLDYAGWELTKFQTPRNFFIYVNDVDEAANYLKSNRFSEGNNGQVILLPKIGDFSNEIERIYLDCMAKSGRSMLDAIAIDLLYGEHLKIKGQFPIEYVKKVQEDLPRVNQIYA